MNNHYTEQEQRHKLIEIKSIVEAKTLNVNK